MKNFFSILLFSLFLSASAHAECVKGDCENGFGEYQWDNGDIYIGQFKKGWRTGKGKYIWPSGRYYEGDFVKNEHHGYGKFVGKNVIKDGRWKKNKFLDSTVANQETLNNKKPQKKTGSKTNKSEMDRLKEENPSEWLKKLMGYKTGSKTNKSEMDRLKEENPSEWLKKLMGYK